MRTGSLRASILGCLFAVLALLVPATAFALQSDTGSTIRQGLAADEDFSTFLGLLDQSDLNGTLEQEGPYTVFAPRNDAFEALASRGTDLSSDPDRLRAVLDGLIVEGHYTVADLRDAQPGSILDVGGKQLVLESSDDGVTVGGVALDTAATDIEFSNGVVHVVTGVIGAEQGQADVANGENAEDAADEAADAEQPAAADEQPAAAENQPAPPENQQAAPENAPSPVAPAPVAPAPAQPQQPAVAMVRVADLAPNAPQVTITLTSKADDTQTQAPEAFSGLTYKAITDYVEVPAGGYTVTLSPSEGVEHEQDVNLDGGSHITLAAIGLVLPPEDAAEEQADDQGGFLGFIQNLFSGGDRDRDALALQVLVVHDDLGRTVDPGRDLVRAVNASPGTAEIDLALVGEQGVVNNDLAFGEVGGYTAIDPGPLEIRIAGSEAATLELEQGSVEPGMITTVYLIGTPLEQAPIATLITSDEALNANAPATQPATPPTTPPAAEPAPPAGQTGEEAPPAGEEQPTEPTEPPANGPSDQSSDQSSDQNADQSSDQNADQSSDQSPGQDAGGQSDQPTDEPSGEPSDQPSDQSPDQPSGGEAI